MCAVTLVHDGIRSMVRISFSLLLKSEGIRAVWREELGGRRAADKNSINIGWKNPSFRGYADYMQTREFSDQIDWLMDQPELSSVVIMCAEAVPWRCHRSLIGDAILARNGVVEDIFVLPDGKSSRKPHSMTPFARMEDGRLFYPPAMDDGKQPRMF